MDILVVSFFNADCNPMPKEAPKKGPNRWEGTHTYTKPNTTRARTVAQVREDAAERIKIDREKRNAGLDKLRRNSIAAIPGTTRQVTETVDVETEEVFFDAAEESMPGSNKKKRHLSNAAGNTPAQMTGQDKPGVDPAMLELLMSIKQDINATTTAAVDKIEKRIDMNAKAIEKVGESTAGEVRKLRQHVQDSLEDFEVRVQKQFDDRDQKIERRLTALEARSSNKPQAMMSVDRENMIRTPRQTEAYNKSRRSLKAWPIAGNDLEDSFKVFLSEKLKFDDEKIRSVCPFQIKKSLGRAAADRSEVVVTFENREDRDMVKAGGVNLAGKVGVGLAIHVPGHLLDNFHALNSIGYNIKQNNEGVRRAIKFDDSIQDVFLDIFVGGNWKRIRPQEARTALISLPPMATNNPNRNISMADILGLAGGDASSEEAAIVNPDSEDDKPTENMEQ